MKVQSECSDLPPGSSPRGLLRVLELTQAGFSFLDEDVAGLGEGQPASVATEKLHFEFSLKLLDVLREGRLRNMQPRGGTSDMKVLCDRKEVAKMSVSTTSISVTVSGCARSDVGLYLNTLLPVNDQFHL